MTKFSDHRAAIVAALKRMDKTRYWLAQQTADVMSMSTLYGYLAGRQELTSDKLNALNKVLGLRYTDE